MGKTFIEGGKPDGCHHKDLLVERTDVEMKCKIENKRVLDIMLENEWATHGLQLTKRRQ